MKLIKPSIEFIDKIDRIKILSKIEQAGRTCYKSEKKITEDSASRFVKMLVDKDHWAMIEHGGTISIKFITDRGVSHELVRNRLASYAQESQRYVGYGSKSKNGDSHIEFIIPHWCKLDEGYYDTGVDDIELDKRLIEKTDENHMTIEEIFESNFEYNTFDLHFDYIKFLHNAESSYNCLREYGLIPQDARGILPNATKTEIIMTANLREWNHFVNLRSKGTTGVPHPDMKILADQIYDVFHKELPEIFK